MIFFSRKQNHWGLEELKSHLASELNISALPDEEANNCIESSIKSVLKGIYSRQVHRFNEIEKEMLMTLFGSDKSNVEEIERYLRRRIPKFDKYAESAVSEFKECIRTIREAMDDK